MSRRQICVTSIYGARYAQEHGVVFNVPTFTLVEIKANLEMLVKMVLQGVGVPHDQCQLLPLWMRVQNDPGVWTPRGIAIKNLMFDRSEFHELQKKLDQGTAFTVEYRLVQLQSAVTCVTASIYKEDRVDPKQFVVTFWMNIAFGEPNVLWDDKLPSDR